MSVLIIGGAGYIGSHTVKYFLEEDEDDETNPTNTYGETKLAMEKMMKWFDNAYGTKYVSLRYFNAAGAYLMEV